MSSDEHEEWVEDVPDAEHVESYTGADSEIEARLEALADEIASVVGDGASDDREALHDYAVSLVRDRMPVADEVGRGVSGAELHADPASGGQNVGIAYGFLILLVAPLLLLVFPPVGMMLLLTGVAMVLWGLVAGFVARFRSGPAADED